MRILSATLVFVAKRDFELVMLTIRNLLESAELTYIGEAENTKRFNVEMKKKGLDAVVAPTVIDELSSNRVLTTGWVQGNRLDRSDEDDVARLCGIALNAYLVMLLETGVL